jgi:hypothetical protein
LKSKLVILPNFTGEQIHFGLGDAVNNFGANTEVRHAVDVALFAERAQFLQREIASPFWIFGFPDG